MTQTQDLYPSFFNDLADLIEEARPTESGDVGFVTWRTHLESTYRQRGAKEALRYVAFMLPFLEEPGVFWQHRSVSAAEILADASREGTKISHCLTMSTDFDPITLTMIERWRLPLGDCGILDFYLDSLAANDSEAYQWDRHALRLLGNCCAEDRGTTPSRL